MPVMKMDPSTLNFATTSPVWDEVLATLVQLDNKPARDRIAHQLSDLTSSLNPKADKESELTVALTEEDADAVRESFLTLDDATIEESELGEDGPATPVRKASTRVRAKKEGRPCECGCGETTAGGRYRPGHDARHLSHLLKAFDGGEGGAEQELIAHGFRTQSQLDERKRQQRDAEERRLRKSEASGEADTVVDSPAGDAAG